MEKTRISLRLNSKVIDDINNIFKNIDNYGKKFYGLRNIETKTKLIEILLIRAIEGLK